MGNQCCQNRTDPSLNEPGHIIVDFRNGLFNRPSLQPSSGSSLAAPHNMPAEPNSVLASPPLPQGAKVASAVEAQSQHSEKPITGGSSSSSNGVPNTPSTSQHRFADGSTYRGQWLDGQPHGKGKMIQPDGSYFDGGWKHGTKEGEGEQQSSVVKIIGRWEAGKLNGKGKELYSDGTRYEGEFRDDERNGYGRLDYPNGEFYQGNFMEGQFSGQGKYHWLDQEFTGQWVSSKMHGKGEYRWADGRSFLGHYENGVRSGYGELYDNGVVVKAVWRKGLPIGRVVEINKEGLVRELNLSRSSSQ